MKEVIILGIGPSRVACPFDAEVWAVARALNMDGLKDHKYSKVFAFDSRNLPALKEPIALALEKEIPLVSTKAYATERYPLEEIKNKLEVDFFKNTICYMIAYALYLGYKKIRLYGVDQAPEWDYIASKPYVLFWMGVAHGMGINRPAKDKVVIELAKGSLLSHLMKDNIKKRFAEIKERKNWSQIIWVETGPVFIKGNDTKVIFTGAGYKPAKRRRTWTRRDILALFILAGLYLIKPFWTIKLCCVRSKAIGQQAANTGLFLRKLQKYHPNKTTYIGISGIPDNKQLLKMFGRKMPIIESEFGEKLLHEPILKNSPFFQDMPFSHHCFDEFRGTKPDLVFTPEEDAEGQALLRRMGIGENDWFVCFHARDNAYKNQLPPNRQYPGDFRNSDIRSMMKAAKYIADSGGYAIRMGFHVEKELPKRRNARIIDYASNYRTDFGDIYLLAKCKFYFGDTGGIWIVSELFNKPVAVVNIVPFHLPFQKDDLFIPKRIWSHTANRALNLREYVDYCNPTAEMSNMAFVNKTLNTGDEVIENTADEIYDLVVEMNESLNGGFKETAEDKKLQEKYQALILPSYLCYDSPARIGTKYLRNAEIGSV